MDQEEVDHTGHCIGSVHSRGAVLQDVDVIDHRKGNEIDVNPAVKSRLGDTFAIDQDQGLFWQEPAQVELRGAITAIGYVLVHGSTSFLWDKRGQVGRVAYAQFLDVLGPVGVHRVRAGLFRSGDVGTGHDHALHLSRGCWRTRRCWNSRSRQLSKCVGSKN